MHLLICIFIGFITHLGISVFTVKDRSILKDGNPFFAKGLDYNLAPPGTGTWDRLTNEEGMQNIFIRDLDNMKAMGANVVRMYVWNTPKSSGFPNAKFTHTAFLDACLERGLYVTVPLAIWPEDSVTDTAKYNDIIDELVSEVYSHPAVFMFTIGNELNNAGKLGGISFSRLFDLINGYALRIRNKEIALGGKKHLISSPFMDMNIVEHLGANENKLTNIDIHCFQIYCRDGTNGKSFGNFFNEYKGLSQKPLIITEFGIDAFKTTSFPNGEADGVTQAIYIESLWKEIVANSDICSGGLVFSYIDEWWKGGNYEGQSPLNEYPPNGGIVACFPDPMQNEGWYGIFYRPFGSTNDVPSDVRDVKSDFMNQAIPRESVAALTRLWKDINEPTVMPNPCLGKTCGPNGKCDTTKNGQCVCDLGFSGVLCDVPDPNCRDGIKNGEEVGIDCGGPACPACDANRWFAFNWGDCRDAQDKVVLCGGGTRTRKVECRDAQDKVVEVSKCADLHPVLPTQDCNMQPCSTFTWETSDWEDCDKPCDGGTQGRSVTCPCSDRCDETTKPENTRNCNIAACIIDSMYWRTTSWTSCIGGTQTRDVGCWKKTNAEWISVTDDQCDQKPLESRSCSVQPLNSYSYFSCPWEQCTAECGGAGGSMFGEQTRTIHCVSYGKVVDNCYCETVNVIKPETKMLGCNAKPCTDYNWMTSPWSACDHTSHKRRRTVHCHTADGANTPDSDCQKYVPEKLPILVEDCDPQQCPNVNPDSDSSDGCGLSIIIDDFSGQDKSKNLVNGASGAQTDGFNTYAIKNSQLTLNAKSSSAWWYSVVSDKCLDLSNYKEPSLYISILGPSNAHLTVELQEKDESCTDRSTDQTKTKGVEITTTGSKYTAYLPLPWYQEKGFDITHIHAISFISLLPNQDFIIDEIGFTAAPCKEIDPSETDPSDTDPSDAPNSPFVDSTNTEIAWSASILVTNLLLFMINNV